jgi:hypothetical protein
MNVFEKILRFSNESPENGELFAYDFLRFLSLSIIFLNYVVARNQILRALFACSIRGVFAATVYYFFLSFLFISVLSLYSQFRASQRRLFYGEIAAAYTKEIDAIYELRDLRERHRYLHERLTKVFEMLNSLDRMRGQESEAAFTRAHNEFGVMAAYLRAERILGSDSISPRPN